MPSPFRPVALAIALLPATLPAAAFADDTLPEVSVTARGYAADTLTTPQAIEVLPLDGQANAAPVGDLLRGLPGLALQSDGAWGQNPVLRGLKKESVVMLVDGVRINSAQPQGAIASFMDVGLLERVEVVKGPSATLYGSGAMGGAVNLITPRAAFADTASHSGRFSLTGSSVDHGLAGAVLYRYASPEHALVLGAAARDVEDYDSPDGKARRTGYRSDSLLAKYATKLTEATTLRVNLQRHSDRDVWYPGSARTGGQPGGAGIPAPLGKVTIHSPRQSRELVELGIDSALGAGQWSAEVYRQKVSRLIRAHSDNTGRDYVRNDVSFVTDGLRTRYVLPLADHHLLTVGAEHWRMRGDPERYMDNNAPLFNNNVRNDPFSDGRVSASGVFVQDELTLGKTTYVGSLRFDRVSGTADQKGVGAAAQTSGLRHADNTWSWSVGAVHAVSPTLNPYVNIGRAWRAADMRERFEDAARGDGYFHMGNPQLEPERATSLEVGVKGRSPSLTYQLAAFHTRIDDYIAGRVTGTNNAANGLPVKRTENLDKVTLWGFEGSLSVPLGAYVGDAGFTWLRGKNHQDDEALAEVAPPELRLGLGQPAERGFYWRAQLRAVSKQTRVATRFTNGGEDATAGFVTADARLGWRFGPFGALDGAGIEVALNNLFDKRYHEHLVQGLSGQELKAPGRGIAVSFNGRF